MGAPDCYKYFVDASIFWIKEYKRRSNDYTFIISFCVDFHMRLLVYSSLAGVLFLPYLAWVAFAATLNAAVFRLN